MFARIIRDNLLAIAEAYCKATGKSQVQISKEFYGNADFFKKLRTGKHSISVGRLDTMIKRFQAEWPDDAEWPPCRMVSMGQNPQR